MSADPELFRKAQRLLAEGDTEGLAAMASQHVEARGWALPPNRVRVDLREQVEVSLTYFDMVIDRLRAGTFTAEEAANVVEHQVRNIRWSLGFTRDTEGS
jgi:hypothetical protein